MLIDLSMPVFPGMPVYPGDPEPSFARACRVDTDGANVLRLALGTHTGTHVDLPLHAAEGASDAEGFPLAAFAGRAALVDIPCAPGEMIERLPALPKADILLLRTGWETMAGSAAYFEDYPYLSGVLAAALADLGYTLIGLDTPSVDPAGGFGPAHRALLERGVPIAEGLVNLKQLSGKTEFFFSAVPLKLRGGDGSPVRAYALL